MILPKVSEDEGIAAAAHDKDKDELQKQLREIKKIEDERQELAEARRDKDPQLDDEQLHNRQLQRQMLHFLLVRSLIFD